MLDQLRPLCDSYEQLVSFDGVLPRRSGGRSSSIRRWFLFKSTDNALEFETEPRSDLQIDNGELQMLRDAAEHDAFLLETLAGSGQRYSIVSPWVITRTMENVGFLG